MRISDWSSDVFSSDLLAAVGAAAVAILVWNLPLSAEFREPSRLALTIEDADGRPIAHRGVSPGGAVPLSALPDHLPAAFLAFEDRRFRRPPGVVPIGIPRAPNMHPTPTTLREGAITHTQ